MATALVLLELDLDVPAATHAKFAAETMIPTLIGDGWPITDFVFLGAYSLEALAPYLVGANVTMLGGRDHTESDPAAYYLVGD